MYFFSIITIGQCQSYRLGNQPGREENQNGKKELIFELINKFMEYYDL